MREAGKIPNLLIRENTKKYSGRRQSTHLKPIQLPNLNSKREVHSRGACSLHLAQEQTDLQNIYKHQKCLMQKEVLKSVSNRTQKMEEKVQTQLISLLQAECNKLGASVDKQKAENSKLKLQIVELRKNISILNRKIENLLQCNVELTQESIQKQKGQKELKEKLEKQNKIITQLQRQNQQQLHQYQLNIQHLNKQIQNQAAFNSHLQTTLQQLRSEKQNIQQFLEEKDEAYDTLKKQFEHQRREWNQRQIQSESTRKQQIDKKGQKINKVQAQLQINTEKLREEEILRKKVTEKNQQLYKENIKKAQIIKDLQDQIITLKKRVNDLSILKSSNNNIMTQKLQQLVMENETLKKNIEILQKNGSIPSCQLRKPILFGSSDAQ